MAKKKTEAGVQPQKATEIQIISNCLQRLDDIITDTKTICNGRMNGNGIDVFGALSTTDVIDTCYRGKVLLTKLAIHCKGQPLPQKEEE